MTARPDGTAVAQRVVIDAPHARLVRAAAAHDRRVGPVLAALRLRLRSKIAGAGATAATAAKSCMAGHLPLRSAVLEGG